MLSRIYCFWEILLMKKKYLKKSDKKIFLIIVENIKNTRFSTFAQTCVKVVLCRRRAGVGQLAVVGVWPMWGLEAQGSGFNFLKAPSAPAKKDGKTLTRENIFT